MVKNKAKQCYVSKRKGDRGRERGDDEGWEEARRDVTEEGKRGEERAALTKQGQEGKKE